MTGDLLQNCYIKVHQYNLVYLMNWQLSVCAHKVENAVFSLKMPWK